MITTPGDRFPIVGDGVRHLKPPLFAALRCPPAVAAVEQSNSCPGPYCPPRRGFSFLGSLLASAHETARDRRHQSRYSQHQPARLTTGLAPSLFRRLASSVVNPGLDAGQAALSTPFTMAFRTVQAVLQQQC